MIPSHSGTPRHSASRSRGIELATFRLLVNLRSTSGDKPTLSHEELSRNTVIDTEPIVFVGATRSDLQEEKTHFVPKQTPFPLSTVCTEC